MAEEAKSRVVLPSCSIPHYLWSYHVLSRLVNSFLKIAMCQCVGTYNARILRILAESYVWCAAWTGTWHLSQQRTRSDKYSCDVLCCAMIRLTTAQALWETVEPRCDSLRLVETWELAQRISKVHTFSFSDLSQIFIIFSQVLQVFLNVSVFSVRRTAGTAWEHHNWQEKDPKDSGKKRKAESVEICWKGLTSHVVSWCLISHHHFVIARAPHHSYNGFKHFSVTLLL